MLLSHRGAWEGGREVERVVVDALAGLGGDLSGRYYGLGQMTDQEQQQLIDVRKES